jgi:hypothetical protein
MMGLVRRTWLLVVLPLLVSGRAALPCAAATSGPQPTHEGDPRSAAPPDRGAAVHVAGSSAEGARQVAQATIETIAFPPWVSTQQARIDWLTAEADRVEHAVEREAEKPVPEQREAIYRATLNRASDLIRLIDAFRATLPRLKGRLSDTIIKANGGLVRIANRALKIGMTPEEVREIRGEPTGITEQTTADGVRQRWEYGTATLLSFSDGRLVEIIQMLQGH